MPTLCGAKNRAGEPCKRKPSVGKTRCKLHGGASTGSPSAKTNALKHGIYGFSLSDSERAQWDALQLGTVDDEIKLCKVRLQRALLAEATQGDKPELDEITVKQWAIGKPTGEKKYKRRDYVGMIDRLMGRIESLEKTRATLLEGGRGGADQSGNDFLRDLAEHLPD